MSSTYHQRLAKIKARYPRAYELWSQEDEALLTEMFLSGKTVSAMADALQRQPSAIQSRLKKRNRAAPPANVNQTKRVPASIPQNGNAPKPLPPSRIDTHTTDGQIGIQFTFQWQPVYRSVSEPYTFPQTLTPYMRHRYKWPAVYRWLICEEGEERPLLMYIGIAKKLCPNRLAGYLQPTGSTNQRLAALFQEYREKGYAVYLEILHNCVVKVGSEVQTPFQIRSHSRRLVLEGLLIDYYKQQGFELLNQ